MYIYTYICISTHIHVPQANPEFGRCHTQCQVHKKPYAASDNHQKTHA